MRAPRLAGDPRRRRRDRRRDSARCIRRSTRGRRTSRCRRSRCCATASTRPDAEELAIATASHAGEADHIELVERLLDSLRLRRGPAAAARRICPATNWPEPKCWPRGELTRRDLHELLGQARRDARDLRAERLAVEATSRRRIRCSRRSSSTIVDITGEPETELGIDGCGLPIVPVSLTNLARAFATPGHRRARGTPERGVADALRAHPRLVSGTGTDRSAADDRGPGTDLQGRRRRCPRRSASRRPRLRLQDRRRRTTVPGSR